MVVSLILLVLGALILYAGAEAAVHGATRLARRAGIPMFLLGALVFGIDVEGLGTTIAAAGRGETAIAAGEAFGTVVFVFTAAFGAALLLARRPVPSPEPLALAAPAAGVWACALVISDRYVGRVEGALLLALYALYVYALLVRARTATPDEAPDAGETETVDGGRLRPVLATAGGLALLSLGALTLVIGGSRLAEAAGLLSGFVGAAILAALTSIDEVMLEVLPVRRGQPDLAIGNLLGTLMAFTTGVPGIAALVRPLSLDAGANLAFLAAALTYAIVASVFFARKRAGRVLGGVLLALYLGWLVLAGSV